MLCECVRVGGWVGKCLYLPTFCSPTHKCTHAHILSHIRAAHLMKNSVQVVHKYSIPCLFVKFKNVINDFELLPVKPKRSKIKKLQVRASCAKCIGAVALKNPELLPVKLHAHAYTCRRTRTHTHTHLHTHTHTHTHTRTYANTREPTYTLMKGSCHRDV